MPMHVQILGLDIRVKHLPKGIDSQLKGLRDEFEGLARRSAGVVTRWMARPNPLGKSAYEVRPTNDGWMITHRGSTVPLRVFPKKPEAVRLARKMGREQKAEVSIFTRQGALQHHQSFAH